MDINLYSYCISNNLFNDTFLRGVFLTLYKDARYQEAYAALKALFDAEKFKQLNEATLEQEWIWPVLKYLGFEAAYQMSKKIQGRTIKPDFVLFGNAADKDAHFVSDKSTNEGILLVCESKAYEVKLDSQKLKRDENPHFQLIDYLQVLKVNIGLLTNGKQWRFYDLKENRANKTFYEIDLEAIFARDDEAAFRYFYDIFRVENFVKAENQDTVAHILLAENDKAKLAVEEELKAVIYGQDSVVEAFGAALHSRLKIDNKSAGLSDIYKNTVTFAFRLLFVAYFEDKFYDELFAHPFYKQKSLRYLLTRLCQPDNEALYPPTLYNAWDELQKIWETLDKGNENLDLALLNGGLFAEENAPLLKTAKVLNNRQLKNVLIQLLTNKENKQISRDFRSLSVQHLGNIYEGLLEFEFREAFEDLYYLIFSEGGKINEGFYDRYDYQQFVKNKKISISYERLYARGSFYFSDQSNSRKSTASYYTPVEFTRFMSAQAIEQALIQDKNPLDLRILDNACGSGHFLIEVLQQLTLKAYEQIASNSPHSAVLSQTLQTEKANIAQQLRRFIPPQDGKDVFKLDELLVLKRILLKKTIFGLDLNPFAVELSRLSLWLDTFIIGTPLSFIEHHIKQGNALIGSSPQKFINWVKPKQLLFAEKFEDKIANLTQELNQLSELKDNSPEQVKASKLIYKQLQPTLSQLNGLLSVFCFQQFIAWEYAGEEGKKAELLYNQFVNFLITGEAADLSIADLLAKFPALTDIAANLAQRYSFFHYEIEFAEVFAGKRTGFDLIVGNPPWDKSKFDDAEFFATYRSQYRSCGNIEKERIRETVLDYVGVKAEYIRKKTFAQNVNSYYKANFPLNEGVGDGNLFRFFIEQNLSLLQPQGALTYLTPSAWSYEDSSIQIRKHILENCQLRFFYQFENRKGIFPRVDSRYKFAVFQLIKSPALLDTPLPCLFMQQDAHILAQPIANAILYSLNDLRLLGGAETLSFLEVKTSQDLQILRHIYSRFDNLYKNNYIDFRRELDMTNDKGIFEETKQADYWPLCEGKTIHQFNPSFAAPTYWLNPARLRENQLSVELYRFVADIYSQIPTAEKAVLYKKYKSQKALVWAYLQIDEKDQATQERFLRFDYEFIRLAFRGISRNTDERTLITSLLPAGCSYGHSMFANSPKLYVLNADKSISLAIVSYEKLLFLNAVFNSLTVDYVLRFMVDINVSKSYLMRLPIAQPTEDELRTNRDYQLLIRNAALLTLSYEKKGLEAIQTHFNIADGDIPAGHTVEKRRYRLRNENEAIVQAIYGLSDAEYQHLTSAAYFKIWNERNEM